MLEREGAAWRKWFFGRLGAVAGSPRQRMLAVFAVLEEWFRDPHFYGCPFINAIGEFATGDARIREAAAAHKSHMISWLQGVALEMGHPAPEQTAREMVVLIDGAIVAAQSGQDPSFAQVAWSHRGAIIGLSPNRDTAKLTTPPTDGGRPFPSEHMLIDTAACCGGLHCHTEILVG